MSEPVSVPIDLDDVASLVRQTRAAIQELEDISTQAAIWADNSLVGNLEALASDAADAAEEVVTDLRRIQKEAGRHE